MPRFAANLTMLYNQLPFPDRFPPPAQSGSQRVHFLFPHAFFSDYLPHPPNCHTRSLRLPNLPSANRPLSYPGIARHPLRLV